LSGKSEASIETGSDVMGVVETMNPLETAHPNTTATYSS